MSSYTGISPKDPNKYLGPTVFLSSIVTRNRIPTGADYRNPNNGKIYAIGSFWLISKDPVSGTVGDLWYLSKVVANVAFWVKLSAAAAGPLLSVAVQATTAPGVSPVLPTVGGLMTINGAVVANHSVVLETRSRALNTFNLEVQYATSAAATDGTKSGVAHFNSTQFSVDANGFVALSGGGAAVDSLGVQATSGSGTDPVVPNGSGVIELEGALIASGTNPLRAVSTAANTVQYQVQTSQAIAAGDSTKTGLSNFNSAHFTVSAAGFVSLVGGSGGITSVVSQVFTANGTYTPTANMTFCIVEVVGAGGGGGGVPISTGASAFGGGGGAGGYSRKIISAATIGASQAVTIGAAGAGGAIGANNGATGGTSSLAALISATGGVGGGGAGLLANSNGGLGGAGSGGNFNTNGNPGFPGGGSSLGTGAYVGYAGNGGSSFFGGGALAPTVGFGASGAAGNNAVSYGGGGSGAYGTNTGSGFAGGNGANGIIVITEFIAP